MDETQGISSSNADEAHFGTGVGYIIAGLFAVWFVSVALVALVSYFKRQRQHTSTRSGVGRWQVAPGGIVTLQTLNSTSPAEKYEFPASSKSNLDLESHALGFLELCAICLEVFENSDTVRRLNCEHVYHQNCIDRWFQGRNFTCPLCKSSVLRSGNGIA
ncbi:hypothetical protein FGSG_14008 [Fusarium graminearum PH-1]|uniref:Chromosome 3, complete genome n=1 Tax=Gibberella zeae (strain ATCC MYA-4620 / CBS 123657 / FGSC 9075 / NRRL 31084 / PH-1) TaxID=229533 RepID=I1SAX7_GIBZE|nr:hypothetical protein FGSG_14008 [Fusarium graminearum PH-1]ESU18396.1 hypothetical protein FGSG_14008 [Fusarium graminearum PH-1]CEF87315.1 unnamed protein product [Fusarium graminearum]|eukprot:XP_011326018.1 hypothetical protein FGSG_14008 [Fusarium graminearum PH-1]